MKNFKNNQGITLVALIITIIVLLILAVVAISAVNGDGIIAHAKNARDDYQTAQGEENSVLVGYLKDIEEVQSKNEEDTYIGKYYLKCDGEKNLRVYFWENDATLKRFFVDRKGIDWDVDENGKYTLCKFNSYSITEIERTTNVIDEYFMRFCSEKKIDSSLFSNVILISFDIEDEEGRCLAYEAFSKDYKTMYMIEIIESEGELDCSYEIYTEVTDPVVIEGTKDAIYEE